MGKEANPKLIGAFILGAIALVVVIVLLLGRGQYFVHKISIVMYFTGSVGGLQVGAPLNFHGVRIGTVIDVKARFDPAELEMKIPVFAEISADRIERVGDTSSSGRNGAVLHELIEKRGLRAQLRLQSLVTGQLAVELDFRPDTKASLIGEHERLIEIPTVPSDIEQLQANLTTVLSKIAALPLKKIVNDIGTAIRSVREVMQPVRNIAIKAEKRIDPLFDELESALSETRSTIRTANTAIASMEKNLNQTLQDADRLIVGVDKQVGPLATSAKAASDDIRQTFLRARKTLSNAEVTLRQATRTLKAAENLVAADSDVRVELSEMLRNISDMADSFGRLADYLERNPSALITGRQGP
jgi:phospholipid/cholesterol/gamma-HCH transport system substrate-binding protein